MAVGVELCSVWASSVSTLQSACDWTPSWQTLLCWNRANVAVQQRLGSWVDAWLWCGSCRAIVPYLVLEVGIKSVRIRGVGKHLWLLRSVWGHPESDSQIHGLPSHSVLLHCLLHLALPAFHSDRFIDYCLSLLLLHDQESSLCCAVRAGCWCRALLASLTKNQRLIWEMRVLRSWIYWNDLFLQ